MTNSYYIPDGCDICKYKKQCSLFKQKIESNGLGEKPEFKCKDYDNEDNN
mgnify:CR=1 FL=1